MAIADLVARALAPRSPERRSSDAVLVEALWGRQTASGVRVTEEAAMRITAVLACARVLGESVASLPAIVYERADDDTRKRVRSHPVARLIREPNEEQTAASFFEVGTIHAAVWGNAYALLDVDGAGRPRRMRLIHPSRVEPQLLEKSGGIQYIVTQSDGSRKSYTADRILHVPGPGYDGVKGMSVIQMAREAIGLAMAAEEFGARFFSGGSAPSGVLTSPRPMKAKTIQKLRAQWNATHSGLRNAHGVVILEEGMDWKPIGIPPEDAQFLETRKFQVNEIARLFRIPPHMIGDLDRATFSNIEQQSLEFVLYTLRPWLVRWEQELTRKLFARSEQDRFYVEFLVDALLRGDIKTRYEAYAIARNWGWMSANDIRRLENLNPVDGGDEYLVPLNMIPAGSAAAPPEKPAKQQEASSAPGAEQRSVEAMRTGRRRVRDAMLKVLSASYGRVVRMEAKALRRAAKEHLGKRGLESFQAWVDEFFSDLPARIRDMVGGAYETLAQQVRAMVELEMGASVKEEDLQRFVADYVEAAAARHVRVSRIAVRKILDAADSDDIRRAGLEELADSWEAGRADRVARQEVVRAGEATAKLAYAAAGITVFRWVTDGDDCPYCAALDGRTVGVEGAFANPGDKFPGGDGKPDLHVTSSVGHPPLHEGCDCMVVPG